MPRSRLVLRNTRKTDTVSSVPPKRQAKFFAGRRHASAPFALLSFSAMLLVAAEPAGWMNKPTNQWTEADARQLLAGSPWSKTCTAPVMPAASEEARREGGAMGQAHGVGYDGLTMQSIRAKLPTNLFTHDAESVELKSLNLNIRWESALPVSVAEMKASEPEIPIPGGEGYRIAVYGVPNFDFKANTKTLTDPLKRQATLRFGDAVVVKPSAVSVGHSNDRLVVVYLFPFSALPQPADNAIQFNAQIGRIIVSQAFDGHEMKLSGKPQI